MRIRKIKVNHAGHRAGAGIMIKALVLLLSAVYLQGCISAKTKHAAPFVPDDFQVPSRLVTDVFEFRVLTVADAEADYEAVMETRERLRSIFGGEWPADNFTLEENKADLLAHEDAFKQRAAFTYTIASLSSNELLGCIYIVPGADTDAQVIYWVRESAYKQGLEPMMLMHLKNWLESTWPFQTITYVGDLP